MSEKKQNVVAKESSGSEQVEEAKNAPFPTPAFQQVYMGEKAFKRLHSEEKKVVLVKATRCDPGTFLQVVEVSSESKIPTGRYVVVLSTHTDKHDDMTLSLLKEGAMAVSVKMVGAGFAIVPEKKEA